MRISRPQLALLASLTLANFSHTSPAQAATLFSQQEVNQDRFAVVASPYSNGSAHQLMIVEQISNARPCWSESGNSPIAINPLLSQFNFTGICGRSIDSNGYSIRVGGDDLNWRYDLRVVRRDNDLLLVGMPAAGRVPNLLIGRTKGVTNGFAKFVLEPGWRVAKRTYNGAAVGHVYLTNNLTLAQLNANPAQIAQSISSPSTRPSTLGILNPAPSPSNAGSGSVAAIPSKSTFGKQELNSDRIVAIASPYGNNAHQLLVVEQISNARPCWSESGNGPTTINPLLSQFDFTGICGRSIDSNGYSIRVSEQDLGWHYDLRVVKKNNDLLLLGKPARDRSAPELLIGKTRGLTSGFAKFYLEPGWRMTKRTYNGTSLGHIYLTHNNTLAELSGATKVAQPNPLPTTQTQVSSSTQTTPAVSRPTTTNPGQATTTDQPASQPATSTVQDWLQRLRDRYLKK